MTVTGIARRKYLVDALNEALPQLQRALLREGRRRSCCLFLQRSLIQHADDGVLAKVLADIKEELACLSGERDVEVETRKAEGIGRKA